MTKLHVRPEIGLFVVETYDGRAFIGELEHNAGTVTVYSGLAGRPPVLDDDEVAVITPASDHPDIHVL